MLFSFQDARITTGRDAQPGAPAMDFPLTDLMDQDACYARLIEALHPDGLTCPRCGGDRLGVHRRHRVSVLDYRCRDCRRVFKAFTGTARQKTSRSPAGLALILCGIAQSAPTGRMARELGCDPMKLSQLRHKLQGHATAGLDPAPLPDATVEADECYVNAEVIGNPTPRAG